MTTTPVSSGVTSADISVTSGNELDVLNGGTAQEIVVSSGGIEVIEAGGMGEADQVHSGGLLIVSSGAAETSIGGFVPPIVSLGGVAIVVPGAVNTHLSGGGSVISTGAVLVSGTTVVMVGVPDGSFEDVGARETGYVLISGSPGLFNVSNGGTVDVYSGGSIGTVHILKGGEVIVFNGGATFDSPLDGLEIVSSGGLGFDASIGSGGEEVVVLSGLDPYRADCAKPQCWM